MMLYEQYEKLTKHNVLNYAILSLCMLLERVLFVVYGAPLWTLGIIYPSLFVAKVLSILFSVLIYYLLLRLLKIKASYRILHNRLAVIKIVESIFSRLSSFVFARYGILLSATGAIIDIIGFICVVYVVDKIYAMTRKQKITFVALSLILDITGRILVAVVK